jgi:hypothetical protein
VLGAAVPPVATELLAWLGAGAAAWKELKAAKSAQSSSIARGAHNYYLYFFVRTISFLFFLIIFSKAKMEGASVDLVAGRTFVVTGGASGLGEATARAFHKAGANVVLVDLNLEVCIRSLFILSHYIFNYKYKYKCNMLNGREHRRGRS